MNEERIREVFSNKEFLTELIAMEVPEDIQKKMGMSEGLVRYSVGLDNDMEHTFQLIQEALKEINFI